jgi:hypothetical protein
MIYGFTSAGSKIFLIWLSYGRKVLMSKIKIPVRSIGIKIVRSGILTDLEV